MAIPLPPASSLHAILLVTKSRSLGPRLVFHYPPLSPSAAALAANQAPAWFANATSTESADSHSHDSSSDWDSGTDGEDRDDDIDVGSRTSGGKGSGRTGASGREKERERGKFGAVGTQGGGSVTANGWGRHESIDEEDGDIEGGAGDGTAGGVPDGDGGVKMSLGGDTDWGSVLGFKVDALEKMLCPGKGFNKRRFELGVEGIVFVGAPMFVRDDGLWKKGRRRKKDGEKRLEDGDLLAGLQIGSREGEGDDKGKKKDEMESFVYPEGFEPGYGHGMLSGAASAATSEAGSDTRSNSTSGNPHDDMTMFNVVFVLNPPALEYQLRVKEMYDNVTRKYAKALKYEQARFQYVWRESKKIINIKQRAKDNGETLSLTWREIIHASPLAKSIAILFDAISQDKIAHIHFDATFNTSFQIPQPDSTPYLPNALEPQMPGMWLTTSNVLLEEDNGSPMTQHAALLLLEDPETLVKELEGDAKGNATPLAFYIRNIIPTKSLLKISIKHNIVSQDMEYIASHLVYWRRARLIAPLHPRDTYIVSPNADMSALQAAIPAYTSRFPMLPSLPKILSMLSGSPKPYRTYIPTSEHREAYMDILAWLMRGGWVTQLRTFAWVRVTPEIKAAVAKDMESEAQQKKTDDARRDADIESLTESMFSDKRSSFLVGGVRPATPMRRPPRRDDDDDLDSNRILSPRTAYRGSPARPASDAGSTTSTRTTIALRPNSPSVAMAQQPSQTKTHRPSPLHFKANKATSPSPSRRSQAFSPTSESHPLTQTTSHQSHQSATSQQQQSSLHVPSPPLSPKTYTTSLILNPTRASSLEARWLEKIGASFDDEEIKELWPMLLRHLDGRHALEDVCYREGIKRKRVEGVWRGVREGGWLCVVRHW